MRSLFTSFPNLTFHLPQLPVSLSIQTCIWWTHTHTYTQIPLQRIWQLSQNLPRFSWLLIQRSLSQSPFPCQLKMTSNLEFQVFLVSSKGKEIVQRKGRLLLSFVRHIDLLGGEAIFCKFCTEHFFYMFSVLPVHREHLSEQQNSPWWPSFQSTISLGSLMNSAKTHILMTVLRHTECGLDVIWILSWFSFVESKIIPRI